MGTLSRAYEILAEAERQLAELTAAALAERDYATVQILTGITLQIAAAREPSGNHGHKSLRPAASAHARGGPAIQQQPTSAAETRSTTAFPHFFRDDNQIVKIGYSKSERRTYEHRSPQEVLLRLSELLSQFATRSENFTTEQILSPANVAIAGTPAYQVYLCLAFLIQCNLVRKHGRAGYSVEPNPQMLIELAKKAFIALPSR